MDGKNSMVKGIYRWIFPEGNNKTYIGKTNNFRDRYYKYKYTVNKSKETKSPINNALKKYGMENCEYRIIEICEGMTNDEILFRESLWIKYYRSLITENGYNLCKFSVDSSGIKRSEEWRLKQIGNQYAKNCWRSKATRAKMSIAAKKRGCKHFNKPINQLDLDRNFIKRWNSIGEALKSLSKPVYSSNIGAALKSINKSAYGFRWEYADKNGVVTHEV